MKYLFIAEKPSLMRDVQTCYRNHRGEVEKAVGEMDFVALSGHVCTNYEPSDYPEWGDNKWGEIDYPMIPTHWDIKMIKDDYKIKTVANIKNIVKNYDGIVVATDSDVEGYGIYYLLEQYLHIENMKALRFIVHSLADMDILKSLLSMTDYHTDPVHVRFTESFLLRSRADWLYGMNATRMMTNKLHTLMTIGRVKAPTIKLVYDNSMEIDHFKPKTNYQKQANYDTFSSTMVDDNGQPVKYKAQAEADDVIVPKEGVVSGKSERETSTHAPKLYDLTSIQSEAGQLFGLTPTETLEVIQSLYETHKVISYPRTQCRYVSEEKAKEFPYMLEKISVFDDLKEIVDSITDSQIARVMKDKEVVNNKEVEKESHDALLPTVTTPNLNAMSENETKICKLIYKRLLAQFLPKLKEKKTKLSINHGDFLFTTTGKVIVTQGWRQLYGNLKDNVLPDLNEGDLINAKEIVSVGKTTTPPKRLTQATLVSAMKNIANLIEDKELKASLADSQGIGTPATRASIIKEIIERGYVEDKKGLHITSRGRAYIENLSSIDIVSPVFAARLDTDIKKVQRGETSYDDIYQAIIDDLHKVCHQIEDLESHMPESNYACPVCGETLADMGYAYKCPKCEFSISKHVCGVEITDAMIDDLYDGHTEKKYLFTKKDGTTFESRLKLDKKGLTFDSSSGIKCPFCGKDVKINRGGCFCDCGLKIFHPSPDRKFTDSELKKLLTTGYLPNVNGFVSQKTGNTYSANLTLDTDENSDHFKGVVRSFE